MLDGSLSAFQNSWLGSASIGKNLSSLLGWLFQFWRNLDIKKGGDVFFSGKKMPYQKHETHGANPLVGFPRRENLGANLSSRMSSVSVKCFVFFFKSLVRFTKKIPKKEGCMAKEDEYRGGIISLFFSVILSKQILWKLPYEGWHFCWDQKSCSFWKSGSTVLSP